MRRDHRFLGMLVGMTADHVLTRIDEMEQRINTLRKQEPGAISSPAGPAAEAASLQTELDGLWDLRRRQDTARATGDHRR